MNTNTKIKLLNKFGVFLMLCVEIQYHTITVVDAAAIGGQCLFICTCKNAALFEEGCGLKGWQLLGFKLGNMEGGAFA